VSDVRLLTVFHYPVFGGPGNQAAQLNAALLAAGVHTTAVLPSEAEKAAGRLTDAGVPVVRLPLHRLRATRAARPHAEFLSRLPAEIAALRRVIRETGADVVQVNGLVSPHAALAARGEGKAIVWQLQDTRAPRWLRAACMPLVLSLADVVMTTGNAVRREHPGLRALGERAVVYYPPVDTELFRPRPEVRDEARARLGGLHEGSLVVGALGNVNAQKGHEYAIRALAACPDRGRLCLRVLGARSEAQRKYEVRLREEASRLGLLGDGRFAIVDPGAELAQLIGGVDVGLLAAVPLSEGVPTMVLEAMAAGVPVIATNVGGVTEAIRNGVNGIVVEPTNVDGIAAALSRLAADASLRADLGRCARQTVLERFSVAHCARTHLHAYQLAMDHRAARRRARAH
jgi:glycosyltransferase involved in cell wall biosynthesis